VTGNVAVEFALTLPVLMLLMLGSAEMARFVILHQKVDRVAVTMSDLVARAETIKESELDDIFGAADLVAQPFDLRNLGIVIVSARGSPGSAAVTEPRPMRARSGRRAARRPCMLISRCARARPRSSPRSSTTLSRS
jgi:Flp pilus assembly protein TadG